ncbi:MAG: mechanosensitive ion channel family protein, partial [Bryobacterales bacterium]|nr:mechanosensitive ion channel family protein [Bryobacterales bacterium]
SRRDKFWFNPALILRLETTADQLLYILAELRKLLYQHPMVERESARVRLASFDNSGYRIEFFSYVLTRDVNEFLAVREDLLLRCLRIIEEGGGGLAYPSQTLYMARDGGVDTRSGEKAAAHIAALRERGELPFPNYRAEDIERMRGTLPYPPPGSALRDGAI